MRHWNIRLQVNTVLASDVCGGHSGGQLHSLLLSISSVGTDLHQCAGKAAPFITVRNGKLQKNKKTNVLTHLIVYVCK